MKKPQRVSEKERERLQKALADYKKQNKLGYTKFYNEIYYFLPASALAYISLSTFQRFVRGDRNPKTGKLKETSDEAVIGLQIALNAMRPLNRSVEMAATIADNIVLPVEVRPADLVQPIHAYEGDYELYKVPYTGQFYDTEFGEPEPLHLRMFSSRDKRILNVVFRPKADETAIEFACFFRCSAYQYLLAHVGRFSVTSFMYFIQTETEPLTLEGQAMSADTEWPSRGIAYDVKLVRINELDAAKNVAVQNEERIKN